MRKIRLGIIGLGWAGMAQLNSLRFARRVEIVAAADSVPPRQPVTVPIHTDWRRLLDDGSLDAVSIALPHHLHAEVVLAALKAGKHILLEKPIAHTLADARRIARAARATRRFVMMEMTHRFYPPVKTGHDLVRSGKLGRIYAVEDRIVEPFPARLGRGWLFQRRFAGGGVAMTNGIHMLDRIAWVCGQALRFHDGVAGWSHRRGDVEDTASMQLSLADGTPVNLLAAWPVGEGKLDDELTIYGTKGTLRIWAWRGWRFEQHGRGSVEHDGYPHGVAAAWIGMSGALTEFATAILENRAPRPSVEDVLAAQVLVDQFYRRVRQTK